MSLERIHRALTPLKSDRKKIDKCRVNSESSNVTRKCPFVIPNLLLAQTDWTRNRGLSDYLKLSSFSLFCSAIVMVQCLSSSSQFSIYYQTGGGWFNKNRKKNELEGQQKKHRTSILNNTLRTSVNLRLSESPRWIMMTTYGHDHRSIVWNFRKSFVSIRMRVKNIRSRKIRLTRMTWGLNGGFECTMTCTNGVR